MYTKINLPTPLYSCRAWVGDSDDSWVIRNLAHEQCTSIANLHSIEGDVGSNQLALWSSSHADLEQAHTAINEQYEAAAGAYRRTYNKPEQPTKLRWIQPKAHQRVSISEPLIIEQRYIRQTSGPGAFAWIIVRIKPQLPETSILVEGPDTEYPEHAEGLIKGIHDGLIYGNPAAIPCYGLHCQIEKLVEHPVDSKARDFYLVARRVIAEALQTTM